MVMEVELPDGNIAEFPDDMSKEQIQGVLAKQFPTTRQMGAPGFGGAQNILKPSTRGGIAETFGVGQEDVDIESGAEFITRLDASFSETDDEIYAKFRDKHPKGKIQRVNIPSSVIGEGGETLLSDVESRIVFKYDWEDPKEKIKTFEDVGVMSIGDFADVVGPLAKAIPEIATTLVTKNPTSMGTFGKLFGVTATTHLAEEGIEEARGFQRQTLSQVLGDAFVQGTLSGAFGVGGRLGTEAANLTTLKGVALAPEERKLLMQYNMLKKHGVSVEEITAAQGAQYSAILQRLQAQSEASSRFMKEKLARQQISAERALEDLPSIKKSSYDLDEGIKSLLSSQYKKYGDEFVAKIKATSPREVGGDVQSAFTKWVKDSNIGVSAAYDDVERLVATSETPLIFDVTPALSKVKEIENAVLADARGTGVPGEVVDTMGNPTNKVMMQGQPLNVADVPTGRLLGIVNDIKALEGAQTNYEAIKQLRTRAGELIESWPWDASYNKGAAKRLYGTLTDVLMNPTGDVVPAYKHLMGRATEMAKARFDVLDKPTIQNIIKSENPSKLAVRFGSPLEMTDEVMAVLRQYPEKREAFQSLTKQNILFNRGGALNSLEEWHLKDPEGLSFILGSSKQKKDFFDLADQFDKLNNSNLKKIAEKDSTTLSVADAIMKGDIQSKEFGGLLKELGGVNGEGHKMLQSSLITRVVNKVVTTDPSSGIASVNNKLLDKEIKTLMDTKAFALLSKEQREKLVGIDAYVKLISPKGKDTGTSLETTSLIAGLKHPSRFLTSVHGLGMNELIARVLSNKSFGRAMLGAGKQRYESDNLIAASLLAKAFLDEEPGASGLPVIPSRGQNRGEMVQ